MASVLASKKQAQNDNLTSGSVLGKSKPATSIATPAVSSEMQHYEEGLKDFSKRDKNWTATNERLYAEKLKTEQDNKSGLSKFVGNVSSSFKKTLFGKDLQRQDTENLSINTSSGSKAADVVSSLLGTGLGYGMPVGTGAGSLMGLSNKIGGKIVEKAIPKANKYIKGATTGVTTTAPLSLYSSGVEGLSPTETAKKVALESLLGAGAGVGVTKAVSVLSKLRKEIPKTTKPDFYTSPYGTTTKDMDKTPLFLEAGKTTTKPPLQLPSGNKLSLPEKAASKIEVGPITQKPTVKNNADFYVDEFQHASKKPDTFPANQKLLPAPKRESKASVTTNQTKVTTPMKQKSVLKENIDRPFVASPADVKKTGVSATRLSETPLGGVRNGKAGSMDFINSPAQNAGSPSMYSKATGKIERPFIASKGEIPTGSAVTSKIKYPSGQKEQPFKAFPGELASKSKIAAPENAGDINTARQKINYDTKQKFKFDGLFTKLRTQLVDKFAPFENLEKNIRGKIGSAESSLYKQARLNEGVPERANVIVEKELKPIIKSIEDKGYNYKDLGLYAEMVHAKDVNAAGLNSGFTSAEINDVISKLGTSEMEAARKQLVEYSNKRLKQLTDNGVISEESYKAMREKWKNYMPLNRSFDDDKVEFATGLGKSFANVGNPIKKLEGSSRDVIDPIESLIKNTYQIENVAGRNKVGQQLSQLAKEDVESKFVRKLKPGEEVGRKNVVNIKEDGVNVSYEVEPEVYKAMLDMNRESSPLWVKALSAPASILRAGATLTPDFALRNPIRDVMNAFITSKSGFNPFTDFAAGLSSYIKKGKLYEGFLRNNGGYGNIISMDRQAHKEAIERVIKQPVSKKVINVINPKTWLSVLREISNATESATKIGEFRAALRSGTTPQEAAYRARDLMDFARSGSSVKEINKVVAFLNANIQGKSKFIRAIKEDPIKVSGKLFITMAIPSIGIYASNNYLANDEQKAIIKDAPIWLKDSFWLVAVPGTDIVARIPKPFEGAAVSNTIERSLDYTIDKDKAAFDGFIKDQVMQQSIPVMMSGITPLIEGVANYSFFRQGPIIPEREKNLQPQDQYDIYTSEISKKVAEAVQKIAPESNFASPRVAESTIKGITAGLGTYVLEGTDAIAGKNKPAKNLNQMPAIKAFTVNDKATGKSMDFIYKERDRITRERNSAKLAKKPFTNEAKYKFLNKITDKIGLISKQIRSVQNDKTLTPLEKRDKINELSDQRNKFTRGAEVRYKQINSKGSGE